jgi:hypothetical protein
MIDAMRCPRRPTCLRNHDRTAGAADGPYFSAERLWLERLKHQPQSLPVWPEFSLDQCQAEAQSWTVFGDPTKSDFLIAFEEIAYQNSKAWKTVEHSYSVVMHSAYHRGQIASDMRPGHTPATRTSFMLCDRDWLSRLHGGQR